MTPKPAVLLVDDDATYRSTIARLLTSRYDVQILHAGNAIAALDVLERFHNTISVIVTDERMPGPRGVVLLTSVRDCWPTMGRVLLTAWSTSQHILSEAAHCVLDKSLDTWLIVDTIGRMALRQDD